MRKLAATTCLLFLFACESREKPRVPLTKGLADQDSVISPGESDDWANIEFRITNVHEKQRLLEGAPWRAPGGDWLIAECTLRGQRFLLGLEVKNDSPWSKGVLIPLGDGEPLLKELATELDQPLPPRSRPAQPLRPVIANTAILGTERARKDGGFGGKGPWTATKWFFESHGRYAELYVNVNFEDGVGEFSEKDPEYREDLVRQLAWALRDGPPPPRTPANDPNLVETGPRFTNLRTIFQGRSINVVFDTAMMFHLIHATKDGERVLAVGKVSEPETLHEIWRTKGTLTRASCREARPVRCVAEQVISSTEGSYSLGDPKKIWLVTAGQSPVSVAGDWDEKSGTLEERALSPDGRFIALSAMQERGKTREFITHVHDLQRRTTTTFTLENESIHFHAWEDDAKVLLESGNVWEPETSRAIYRASAASPALEKVRAIDSFMSPGKTRAFVVDDANGKLVVRAANGTRSFTFHPDDRGTASFETLRWLNERYILFDTERLALIDTDTMKMNYPGPPEWSGGMVVLSPDGRHLLYTADETVVFAAIQ